MRPKPIKALGQNFLIDQNIQRKIIASCQLGLSDTIIEIGPGRGELTNLLVGAVKSLYAFEKDSRLAQTLEDSFKGRVDIKIINKDILKVDLNKYIESKKKIKVIGNIPYYISTPIIEKLLEHRNIIDTIFITVQKEFAERIVANPGPKIYGSLSCFVQYYSNPKILFTISNSCFRPKPKVDSVFLELKVLPEPSVKVNDEDLFFKIIRAAFNQRRKTLRNSLEGVISKEKLEIFFAENNINPNIRPEQLSLKYFSDLAGGS
ncbi:MAG: 16S rRNA (adenine(1518)-N(6)/adenine(1519)-N(6))-dimethyltransferase RsmA [Candidatus Omnitrophota bacterium]